MATARAGEPDKKGRRHPPEEHEPERPVAVGTKGQACRAGQRTEGSGAFATSLTQVDTQDGQRRSEHHRRADERHQ